VRANWFLGLPVEPDGRLLERLGDPPPRVRVFAPEDLHVTVAFLGPCGEDAARAAWELARGAEAPAGTATLDRVVPLGPPRRPSALSALLADGHRAMRDYLAEHRNAWLDVAGARPDPREPLPHCTLARPQRRATAAERQRAVAWGQSLSVGGLPVRLRPLALYTWAEDRRHRLFRIVEAG
jgi:RNA 2',3'-cyclic 3'-phosphodiesterase